VEIDEARKTLDEILERLRAKERESQVQRKVQEKSKLIWFGFREHEAEAWLKQEPDFDKPIIKRRDKKLTKLIRQASNLSYPARPYRSWVRVLDLANPPAACLSK